MFILSYSKILCMILTYLKVRFKILVGYIMSWLFEPEVFLTHILL